MTSRLLFIVGCLLTLSTIVLCDDEEIDLAQLELEIKQFYECRNRSLAIRDFMYDCILKNFTTEEMKETSLMYNDTECIKCKHFCRIQDTVFFCVREFSEALEKLSNRSRLMVPFVREIAEAAISTSCENDAEFMRAASTEGDTNCIINTWNECRPRLDHVQNLPRSSLCDLDDPDIQKYTKEYICKKLLDFLECAENVSGSCSSRVQNSAAMLLAKLRNLEICSKFY